MCPARAGDTIVMPDEEGAFRLSAEDADQTPPPPDADDAAGERFFAAFDLTPDGGAYEWRPGEHEEAAGTPADEKPSDVDTRLLGIRLRRNGPVFFFPDAELTVRSGSKVVVKTDQGLALGEVESVFRGRVPSPEEGDDPSFSGAVLRLATAQDIAQHSENSILTAEAAAFCRTCIRQRNLDMKLVDVEVLHDRAKIIFFFTAPARIDFRELVKDLVRNYRTRIELRQIGVRHETQMIGAIGNCGMVCCCHQYLRKFAPVTIKMAKEQNLFLNPSKLSGMCGRLLCCLSFEQGNYEEFNRRCPKFGKRFETPKGIFKALRANMFTRSLSLLSESGEEVEMSLEAWEGLEPRRLESPAPEPQRSGRTGMQERGPGGRNDNGLDGPDEAAADMRAEQNDGGDTHSRSGPRPRRRRRR